MIFMLGKDLGETVAALDGVSEPTALVWVGVSEYPGIEDIGPKAQLPGDLPGDGDLIAGDHLDSNASSLGGFDGRSGIIPGRIGEGENT